MSYKEHYFSRSWIHKIPRDSDTCSCCFQCWYSCLRSGKEGWLYIDSLKKRGFIWKWKPDPLEWKMKICEKNAWHALVYIPVEFNIVESVSWLLLLSNTHVERPPIPTGFIFPPLRGEVLLYRKSIEVTWCKFRKRNFILPSLQFCPEYPMIHLQLYVLFPVLLHVAPFLQGSLLQASTDIK